MSAEPAPQVSVSSSSFWARNAYVLLPSLLYIVLLTPVVAYQLPAYESHLGETYQPLRALKFFKSKGDSYHKYGPMPNYLLAPGYGVSLGYWYATGSFKSPSDDFPYGFQNPLRQLTILIAQGRILFSMMGVIAFAILAVVLRRVGVNRWPIAIAPMVCLVTNVPVLHNLPSARPDSPMLTFVALALALYLWILHRGLTPWRGFWLSVFAVCAISSKELAGPLFVFPYMALIWMGWRESRDDAATRGRYVYGLGAALITGPVLYLLLNVVYAPSTWLKRMEFWVGGAGADDAVWGSEASFADHLSGVAIRLWSNFGPAGVVVVVVAVALLLLHRPKHWLAYALPILSVMLLGLLPMGYSADRFYTIAALSAVPVVALGLDAGMKTVASRKVLLALSIFCIVVNVHYATFAWISLSQSSEVLREKHAQANVKEGERINLLTLAPRVEGKSRLEWMGFDLDPRPIHEISADAEGRPDWIYVNAGTLGFIEDSAQFPARAEMLKEESGFDIETWPGMEGAGYRLAESLNPTTPGWFPYTFMHAVRGRMGGNTLLVYRITD
jgi:hypothetical protein